MTEDCGADRTNSYEFDAESRQQNVLLDDGGTILNLGQKSLNFCDDQSNDVRSVFQSTAVTRPMMSVGRICDEGHEVTFDAVMTIVKDSGGTEICRFTRQPGGLYVVKMKFRNPMGFAQPE